MYFTGIRDVIKLFALQKLRIIGIKINPQIALMVNTPIIQKM